MAADPSGWDWLSRADAFIGVGGFIGLVVVLGLIRRVIARPSLGVSYEVTGDQECRKLELALYIPPSSKAARFLAVSRPAQSNVKIRYSVWDSGGAPIRVWESDLVDIIGVGEFRCVVVEAYADHARILGGIASNRPVAAGSYRCRVSVENNDGGMGPYVADFVIGARPELSTWTRSLTPRQARRTSAGQPTVGP